MTQPHAHARRWTRSHSREALTRNVAHARGHTLAHAQVRGAVRSHARACEGACPSLMHAVSRSAPSVGQIRWFPQGAIVLCEHDLFAAFLQSCQS
eukprot:6176169-Pleurochrysis_carterae.AAC.1